MYWDGTIDYIGDEEFMVRACFYDNRMETLTLSIDLVDVSDPLFENGAVVGMVEKGTNVIFISQAVAPRHPLTVNGLSVKELAREVANLRYDALGEFLTELKDCFQGDSVKDRERGNNQVAKYLNLMSNMTKDVQFQASKLWKVCKPHREDK